MASSTWEEGLELIHKSGDYITHEAFKNFSDGQETIDYTKRDFLFRGGSWRGNRVRRYKRSSSKVDTLILGHSDYALYRTQGYLARTFFGVKWIFASNLASKMSPNSRLQALPLGLSNPTSESQVHRILGRQDSLRSAWNNRPNSPSSPMRIYANFSVSTSEKHRASLYKILSELREEVTLESPVITAQGRSRYLAEIASHRIVLCPRGNGMDTHRFWETLYLGAIPVVLDGSYQHLLASHFNLPAIPLINWGVLRERYCREKLIQDARNLLLQDWTVESLSMAHWENRLKAKIRLTPSGADHPRLK